MPLSRTSPLRPPPRRFQIARGRARRYNPQVDDGVESDLRV